jgi:thiosulfate/3-mercaptopyruvate sulfurtransferase
MAFRRGRIPLSQHVDWKNWSQERADFIGLTFGKAVRAGKVKIADEKIQTDLRKLGLSNSRPVVVVGEPHGWGEDGRIAWNLLYWGAEKVAILDGGYEAWTRDHRNKPEIGKVQQPLYGTFTIQVKAERRADIEQVKSALSDSSYSIIDNRSEEEFKGKKLVGQKRGGHLPSARSVPVDMLYNNDGTFIDGPRLEKLCPSIKDAVIAYCAGGVRSALFAMLMEARFDMIVANYDGSMWEWSAQSDLPLE